MIWFWYALATAVIIAVVTLLEKRVLVKEHATEFVVALSLMNLVFSIPLFFKINYHSINIPILGVILGSAFLATFSQILNARSLRHMDVSTVSPLYVTTPAITALLAFLFLGEKLSQYQLIGIVILIVGTYLLEVRDRNLFSPIKKIVHSKYFHFVFFSILLYSINSLIGRYILVHYKVEPQALLAFVHLFLAILLFSYFLLRYDGWTGVVNSIKRYGLIIVLISILTVVYRLAELKSLQLASVGIVVAVVKSSGLFSTIIGGRIFKEKNLLIKTLACIIIITGMIMVVI